MKDGPTANWLPAGRGDDSRPHQARRARRRWQGQRWRGRRVRRRKRLRRQRRGGISVFGGDGSGLASDRCCGRACPGAGCTSAIDSPCDATRETMPERIRKARVENRLRVTEVKKITKSAIEEQGCSLRCGRGEPGAATCFRALPHREQGGRWQHSRLVGGKRMSLAFGECMPVRLTWKVLESNENNGRVDGERVGLVPRSSTSTRRAPSAAVER